jgi:radical SAM superfamily enzyme YgiQ (UPF0313 family)
VSSVPVLLISFFSLKGHHYARRRFSRPMMPSLGLLSIASYAAQRGRADVSVLDFAVDRMTRSDFSSYLRERRFRIVGMSLFAETQEKAVEIARLVKTVLPDAMIVFGGAQATFTAAELLGGSAGDFVCMGEGEMTFAELVEAIADGERESFGGIRGLAWKSGGEVHVNPPRNPIRNLDALPLPNRELIAGKRYRESFTVLSGRGCTGDCGFCCSRAFWGSGVRLRSAESLFAEVVYLHERREPFGIAEDEMLCILDDSFTLRPARVKRFCAHLIDAGFRIDWQCASRLDVLDEDLLRVMQAAGCRHIQIGVESVHEDVLRETGKKIDISQLECVLEIARAREIEISLGFMIGFPNDTKDTIRTNVEAAKRLWRRYDLDTVSLTFNTPYPGTRYFNDGPALGLHWTANRWSQYSMQNPLVWTDRFTQEDLAAAFNDFSSFASRHRTDQMQGRVKSGVSS